VSYIRTRCHKQANHGMEGNPVEARPLRIAWRDFVSFAGYRERLIDIRMNLRQLQIRRSLNNRMGTRNGAKLSHDRQVYTGARGVHAAAQSSAAMCEATRRSDAAGGERPRSRFSSCDRGGRLWPGIGVPLWTFLTSRFGSAQRP
jgi:hypothetical protein